MQLTNDLSRPAGSAYQAVNRPGRLNLQAMPSMLTQSVMNVKIYKFTILIIVILSFQAFSELRLKEIILHSDGTTYRYLIQIDNFNISISPNGEIQEIEIDNLEKTYDAYYISEDGIQRNKFGSDFFYAKNGRLIFFNNKYFYYSNKSTKQIDRINSMRIIYDFPDTTRIKKIGCIDIVYKAFTDKVKKIGNYKISYFNDRIKIYEIKYPNIDCMVEVKIRVPFNEIITDDP